MTELEALQATLEDEHAAVYLFGLLGSQTSQSLEPTLYAALRAAYEAHRERRDVLIEEVVALGATPVAAAPAYVSPPGLETAAGRTAAALALEQGCARSYATLVGSSAGAVRITAIGFLDDAAVRALAFRGNPEIFPGAGEHADR